MMMVDGGDDLSSAGEPTDPNQCFPITKVICIQTQQLKLTESMIIILSIGLLPH